MEAEINDTFNIKWVLGANSLLKGSNRRLKQHGWPMEMALQVASEPPQNVMSGTLPPLQPAQVEEVQRAEIRIGLSVYLLRRKYAWTSMGFVVSIFLGFLFFTNIHTVQEATPEQDLWSFLKMMGLIGFNQLLFAIFEGIYINISIVVVSCGFKLFFSSPQSLQRWSIWGVYFFKLAGLPSTKKEKLSPGSTSSGVQTSWEPPKKPHPHVVMFQDLGFLSFGIRNFRDAFGFKTSCVPSNTYYTPRLGF